jgi:hypothetical protein
MQTETQVKTRLFLVALMKQQNFSEIEIADTLESLTKQEQKKS